MMRLTFDSQSIIRYTADLDIQLALGGLWSFHLEL